MLIEGVGTLVAWSVDWASGAEAIGSAAEISLVGNLERVRVERNDAVGHSVSFVSVNETVTVAVMRLWLVDGVCRSLSTVGGELEGGSVRCVSTETSQGSLVDNLLDWGAVGKRSGSGVRAASVGAESVGANGTGISGLATKVSLWCDVVVIRVVVRLRSVDISDVLWSGVGSRSLAVRSTAVRSTTVSGSTVWGLPGSSVRWEIELPGTVGGDLLGEVVVTVVIGFGSVDIIGVGLLSEAETTWAKVGALRSVVSPDWARATVGSSAAERARATVRSTTASVSATSGSAEGDLIVDTTISFAVSSIVTVVGGIRGVVVVVLVEDLLDWSSLLGSESWQLAVAERAGSAERTLGSETERSGSTAVRGGSGTERSGSTAVRGWATAVRGGTTAVWSGTDGTSSAVAGTVVGSTFGSCDNSSSHKSSNREVHSCQEEIDQMYYKALKFSAIYSSALDVN